MKKALLVIGLCLIAMIALNVSAENRPHDQIMRDVNSAFTALKKDIDANASAVVQEDAVKLQSLFKEVEVFWTPLRSKTAVDAAKTVQSALDDVAAAARANDLKRADTLYGSIGKTCKACHDRHRVQMPDKTFKIRP